MTQIFLLLIVPVRHIRHQKDSREPEVDRDYTNRNVLQSLKQVGKLRDRQSRNVELNPPKSCVMARSISRLP